MDEELTRHIFEPFFSTKERGTGLGLAVVRQIVEGFGGRVQVVAYDATQFAIEQLRSGVITLVLAQKPFDMGYMAVQFAAADAAGVTLRLNAGDLPPSLELDQARIRQVIGNLLENALRFTPRGGQVSVEGRRREGGVELVVRDTGAGIEAEALERIFDRFYRAPESRGSGLGLPIARSLVEAHGGIIQAESEPGRGTVMRVTLPAS